MQFTSGKTRLIVHCFYFADILSVPGLKLVARLQSALEPSVGDGTTAVPKLPEFPCWQTQEDYRDVLGGGTVSPSGNWFASFSVPPTTPLDGTTLDEDGTSWIPSRWEIFLWKIGPDKRGGIILPTRSFPIPEGTWVDGVMFAPQSDLLFVWFSQEANGGTLTTVQIYDPEAGKVMSTFAISAFGKSQEYCILLHPLGDGKEFLCVGGRTGTLLLINSLAKKVEWRTTLTTNRDLYRYTSYAAVEDDRVAIPLETDGVLVVDAGRRSIRKVPIATSYSNLAWLPGKDILLVPLNDSCDVALISASSLQKLGTFNMCENAPRHHTIDFIATSPGGMWLAVGTGAISSTSRIALYRALIGNIPTESRREGR